MKAIEDAQKKLDAGKLAAQKDSKKDNVYQLNVEFERRSNEGHEASTDLRKCLRIMYFYIGEANEAKNNHFKQVLPTTLYNIQKDDEKLRIESIKNAFLGLTTGFRQSNAVTEQSFGRMV
jgi:hypothetical protein